MKTLFKILKVITITLFSIYLIVIVGGLIIMTLVYTGLGNLALVVPAVLHAYFDLFAGLLQSFDGGWEFSFEL